MNKSAPEWGADTHLSHRTDPGLGMPTAWARCLHRDGFSEIPLSDRVCVAKVRVGSSYADNIDSFPVRECGNTAVTPFSAALSQSERGLDSAERSPTGDPEARASGKSGAARSDRRETSGGSCGVVV